MTVNVLFVCIHNAGRSQMAAGFVRSLGRSDIVVWSGGSDPREIVNPTAVAAMMERGIDISSQRPQRWTDTKFTAADIVVTMGCGDTCPVVPGKRYEDWTVTDPAGKSLDEVRDIRDQIERRVMDLVASIATNEFGCGLE